MIKLSLIRAKRGVALTAAALLAVSVTACGNNGGGGSAGGKDATFTVAYLGALSGPVGASGRLIANGMKAGVDYVNSLDGVKFEFEERDTKGDPSTGANLARELAQSGVDSIYAGTTDVAAIQPVLNQHKILAADSGGITAILPKMGEGNEFPWTFCPNPACGPNQIVPQLRFAEKVAGGGPVGEIADTGPFGSGTMTATDQIVKEQFAGMQLVKETFPQSATSVTAQLSKLRDSGAKVLIVWTYGAPLVMLMQSLDRIGWYPYIATVLGAGDPSVVAATPAKLQGRVVAGGIAAAQVTGSGAKASPLAKTFFDRYTKITAGPSFTGLDTVGSYSFDWVVVLHSAIKATGSTDPQKIREWLTAGNTVMGSQGPLTFGKTGLQRIGLSLDDTAVYDPSKPCTGGLCSAPSVS